MGDFGYNPIDGWSAGPGSNPQRPAIRHPPGSGGGFSHRPTSMPPPSPFHSGFGPSPTPMLPGRTPRGIYDPNFGMNFGIPGSSHGGRASAHGGMDFRIPGSSHGGRASAHGGMDFRIPGSSHGGRASAHGGMDFGIPGSSHGSRASARGSHRSDPSNMRVTETAVVYPLSPAGGQIHCIIDTGASMTSVKRSMLRRHFPRIAVKRDIGISMMGIDGGSEKTNERVMLPLTFVGSRGERIQTVGEVWLTDGKHLDTEILLGLPFLRDNGMHLQWGGGAGQRSGGDYISCRGSKIPIKIDARED